MKKSMATRIAQALQLYCHFDPKVKNGISKMKN